MSQHISIIKQYQLIDALAQRDFRKLHALLPLEATRLISRSNFFSILEMLITQTSW